MWFDVRYIKHIKVARGRALHYTKTSIKLFDVSAPVRTSLRLPAPICTYLRLPAPIKLFDVSCMPLALYAPSCAYLRLSLPICAYLHLSAPICTYLRLAVQVWTYLCLPAAIDVALHQAHQSLVSALVCRFGVALPLHQSEFCCAFGVVWCGFDVVLVMLARYER